MGTAEIVVIVVAVLAGATIKSVTGLGLPIVAIPIISVVAGPEVAVAVLAIPNAAQNLVLAVRNRRHVHETVALGRLVVAGIGGAALGAFALGVVPEDVIVVVLVLLIASYLATTVWRPDLRLEHATATRWAPLTGFAAGVFQGGAGISGPLIGTWNHALRLPREAFVLSVSLAFLLSGATQVAVFASTGLLEGRLLVSALLTVIVLATVPLGGRVAARLSVPAFDLAVRGLLAVSLVALVVDLAT